MLFSSHTPELDIVKPTNKMNSNKRKGRSNDGDRGRDTKRNKGGSGGKWQTPHQQAKMASIRGRGTIEPGDVGIWATCARGQEGKATTELRSMLNKFAEQFYGITAEDDEEEEEEDGEKELDIESSIRKEIAGMDDKLAKPRLFSTVRLDIECVLFVKVQSPIDPVDFVHRICKEVESKPDTAKTRYINRLTPMSLIGKATDKGLEDVAKTVIGKHFKLASGEQAEEAQNENGSGEGNQTKQKDYSYAIRPTIRNHNTLKRDVIIKQIASSIADIHKVNLTKPDKVILVEIYQTVCGVSVVGDDWETLKRFNVGELSKPTPKSKSGSAIPERVTTDEASGVPTAGADD